MRPVDQFAQLPDYLRVISGDIAQFTGIGREIEELIVRLRGVLDLLSDQLPLPHADRLTSALLMKLPVEIRVLRLFASTGKGGKEGDPVRLSLRSGSGEFLQGWHYVPEGEHVVGRTTGLDHLGPHSDERCPHTSLVEGTLKTAVGTIAVKEVRIVSTLLVRPIV